jgi:hypothetical protein
VVYESAYPDPTTKPAATPPTTSTPVSVSQGFSDLRNTINTIGLPSDMQLDFSNLVNNLQNTVVSTPQNGPAAVKQLQQHIIVRSMDLNPDGTTRMSQSQESALLNHVNELNAALGYPPLT